MSTCRKCRTWDSKQLLCWKLATIAREAIRAHGIRADESIRVTTYADSSCLCCDELPESELQDRIDLEVTNIDVLKAQAAANSTTAEYWRRQCERAEIRVRQLEQALVEAGKRADAFGIPLTSNAPERARAAG